MFALWNYTVYLSLSIAFSWCTKWILLFILNWIEIWKIANAFNVSCVHLAQLYSEWLFMIFHPPFPRRMALFLDFILVLTIFMMDSWSTHKIRNNEFCGFWYFYRYNKINNNSIIKRDWLWPWPNHYPFIVI